jgi:hypothetical protein
MALQKINVGTNEDGSPRWQYVNPDGHLVITGPITGEVTLADGSTVNVTPDVIEADSPEHALAVSDAIGRHYETYSHPLHDGDQPFTLTPSEVTHESDGTPSAAFASTVEAHIVAGKDSSPQGVLAALSGSNKKG